MVFAGSMCRHWICVGPGVRTNAHQQVHTGMLASQAPHPLPCTRARAPYSSQEHAPAPAFLTAMVKKPAHTQVESECMRARKQGLTAMVKKPATTNLRSSAWSVTTTAGWLLMWMPVSLANWRVHCREDRVTGKACSLRGQVGQGGCFRAKGRAKLQFRLSWMRVPGQQPSHGASSVHGACTAPFFAEDQAAKAHQKKWPGSPTLPPKRRCMAT